MEILSYGEDRQEGPLTLVLHGFPGIRSKQNREIAETIASRTAAPVRLVLYAGLGHAPGVFSFQTCVEQVRSYFADLIQESATRPVNLVGHSWGGFLSLVLAREFPEHVRRVALMSPLLQFFDETTMAGALQEYQKQYSFLRLEEPSSLAREFVQVGKALAPENLIRALSDSIEILFLQASDDPITPPSVAESHLPFFVRQPDYRVVTNDHSFLSRRVEVATDIASFLMR